MNLNRGNMRKIRGLVLFTAVVILALLKFDLLWMTVIFCLGILRAEGETGRKMDGKMPARA